MIHKKPRKKYVTTSDATPEDVIRIKLQNKQRLDEIMSRPNYIEELAKKYYGDDWMRTIDTNHYMKVEKRKKNAIENNKKQKDGNFTPRIPATTIPIVELTLEGKFIKEWTNIKMWREQHPTKHYVGPIQCAQGKASTAYDRLWKFKTDYENGK
jgi:hypothetical protein